MDVEDVTSIHSMALRVIVAWRVHLVLPVPTSVSSAGGKDCNQHYRSPKYMCTLYT